MWIGSYHTTRMITAVNSKSNSKLNGKNVEHKKFSRILNLKNLKALIWLSLRRSLHVAPTVRRLRSSYLELLFRFKASDSKFLIRTFWMFVVADKQRGSHVRAGPFYSVERNPVLTSYSVASTRTPPNDFDRIVNDMYFRSAKGSQAVLLIFLQHCFPISPLSNNRAIVGNCLR